MSQGLKEIFNKFKEKFTQGNNKPQTPLRKTIVGISILGIGYYIYIEYIEEKPQVVNQKVLKKKIRKKTFKTKNAINKNTPTPEPAPAPAPAPASPPAPTLEASEESKEEVADIPPETPLGPIKIKEKKVKEEILKKSPEPPQDVISDKKSGESIEQDQGVPDTSLIEKKSSVFDQMEKKIEKDFSYVPAPDYERAGRGLVYNCIDRHWACVNRRSYEKCFENQKWTSKKSKQTECHIKNVYASYEDCIAIQKYYISQAEKTDFCN